MAVIIHFHGEGRGFYSGATDLVTILESKPTKMELEDMTPSGFKALSVTDTDIDELPYTFPRNEMLKVI